MALFCPMNVGQKPTRIAKYTVYTLKKARRRQIPILHHVIEENGDDSLKMESSEDDDDNDSGYSHASSSVGSGLPPSPNLAKTELARRLSDSSEENPVFFKARVLWDYREKTANDFQVEKDEIVNILYRQNDKVYVINKKGHKGFLPFSYCTVFRKSKIERSCFCDINNNCNTKITYQGPSVNKLQKSASEPNVNATKLTSLPGHKLDCNTKSTSEETSSVEKTENCQSLPDKLNETSIAIADSLDGCSIHDNFPDENPSHSSCAVHWNRKAPESYHRRLKVSVMHFRRDGEEPVAVLFDFYATDENDVSVQRGETVNVLNKDDPDWWWVERENGDEGFVPRSYVSAQSIKRLQVSKTFGSTSSTSSEASCTQVRFQEPLCTIHSYEREECEFEQDEDDDSKYGQSENETDNDDGSLDFKWSMWC